MIADIMAGRRQHVGSTFFRSCWLTTNSRVRRWFVCPDAKTPHNARVALIQRQTMLEEL